MRKTGSAWTNKNRKTVQKSIPISAVYEDGVFRCGKEYSIAFEIGDINYAATSEINQAGIILNYEALIKAISSEDNLKIVLINRLINEKKLAEYINIPLCGDKYDSLKSELNYINADRALRGSNKIVRNIYAVLSSKFPSYSAALPWIKRERVDFASRVKNIGAACKHMTATDRLKVLHHFFKPDMDDYFNENLFSEVQKSGETVMDYIAPEGMEFPAAGTYFKIDDRYGRALMIRDFPAQMDDTVLTDLMSLSKEMIVTVDYVTIDKNEAIRIVNRRKDAVEADIAKRTKNAGRESNWNMAVPQHLQEERENCDYLFNCINEQDQKLVMTQVTILHMADTLEELNADTSTIKGVAAAKSCEIGNLRYRQERGLDTALPYGLELVNQRRLITSENGAFLQPFRTKEIFEKGGLVYGVNEISHNLIVINRKSYDNGNAFAFGIPGSGKTFFIKTEIEALRLIYPNDEIIILDPDGEYRPLVDALGGQFIRISATSEDHINIMDLGRDYDSKDDPITLKCLFIDGLVDIMMRGTMTAAQRSVTGRCVGNVLGRWAAVKNKLTGNVPTLKTLYDELKAQKEPEAQEVALALEMYAIGKLDVFAHPTNINIQNKLICFDIKDLSAQMHELGMLVVIDEIDRRVARNRKRGINTWLYFDEIWSLLNYGKTADYLWGAWKRFRKYGGLPTGISQNVSEILSDDRAATIVLNSEFIYMFNQAQEDKEQLVRLFDISPDQERYISNSQPGHGLLKAGKNLIPFNGEIDKNTQLYKLATTKLSEVKAYEKDS